MPTVLVVDDEERNRVLVRECLRAHTVIEAADAAGAYEVLARTPVDLVLLDVMMPGESGLEACVKIKANARDYLPVLLLTALNDQETRNAGLRAGADDFLSKPIDRQELRLRVDAFLRLRLQEQRIAEQLTALARADALKDDLVSLLVHDLRNPLTAMFTWIHMLDASATPEQKVELAAVQSAASRVKEAVDDLLQIRALEHGALTPELKLTPVDEVITTAISMSAGPARERRVTLRTATSGVSGHLDPVLLRRALLNLVENAVKYAPAESTVDVAAEVIATPAGRSVRLAVADRGAGIPDDKKGLLFSKFGVLDPTLRRTRRGFGLGLYFVHLIADAHGGTVEVRDHEGGGSVFVLTLPGATP